MTYSEITFFNCLLRVVTDTNFKANGQKLMKLEQFEFSTSPLRFSAGIAFALPFEGDGLSELPFDSLQTCEKIDFRNSGPFALKIDTHTDVSKCMNRVKFHGERIRIDDVRAFRSFHPFDSKALAFALPFQGRILKDDSISGSKIWFFWSKIFNFQFGWMKIDTNLDVP